MKRVFLIVLDSVGIGEMPDAALFGDEGSDTLRAAAASPYFAMPFSISTAWDGPGKTEGFPKPAGRGGLVKAEDFPKPAGRRGLGQAGGLTG